jgi:hypothetical protein
VTVKGLDQVAILEAIIGRFLKPENRDFCKNRLPVKSPPEVIRPDSDPIFEAIFDLESLRSISLLTLGNWYPLVTNEYI